MTDAKEVDLENPMEKLGAQMANHRTRKILTAKLPLSADVLVTSDLTESDCLIELAVHLYAQRRITVENAVQISQLSRVEFDDAFARRRH